VEAMALDCPVICSQVTSLPEVGGDAAFYAQLTADSYLKAMQALTENSGLRDELVKRGRKQARKFSWRKCAEETVQIYRKIMG
jgi:glycosyltransferase involved in cell wall biosynthesis